MHAGRAWACARTRVRVRWWRAADRGPLWRRRAMDVRWRRCRSGRGHVRAAALVDVARSLVCVTQHQKLCQGWSVCGVKHDGEGNVTIGEAPVIDGLLDKAGVDADGWDANETLFTYLPFDPRSAHLRPCRRPCGLLNRHLRQSQCQQPPKHYTCAICTRKVHRRSALARHNLSAHLDIKTHQCQSCQKAFSLADYLANHIKKRRFLLRFLG